MIVELERRVAGLPTKHKGWERGCRAVWRCGERTGSQNAGQPISGEWAHALIVVDRYSIVRAEKPGLLVPGQGYRRRAVIVGVRAGLQLGERRPVRLLLVVIGTNLSSPKCCRDVMVFSQTCLP